MSFYVAALHHRTGDVVFSRDRDVLSRAIRIAHLLTDRKPGRFSHVALCAFPGLFVDSIPEGGVRVFEVEQKENDCVRFNRILTKHPIVLRLPFEHSFTNNIIESIAYWTGQQYSFRFLRSLGAKQGEAFCSQFIAQVFLRALVNFGEDDIPLHITPSSLYDRMKAAGAIDVTELYVKFEEILLKGPETQIAFSDDLPRAAIRIRLLQSINAALTSNISASTSISTIKQQMRTGNALIEQKHMGGTIYDIIHKALNNVSIALMSFLFLRSGIKIDHWSHGLTAVDKAELDDIITTCLNDVDVAAQHIRELSNLISSEEEIVNASLDEERDLREACAIKCSQFLSKFSDEEEEKLELSFQEALREIAPSQPRLLSIRGRLEKYRDSLEQTEREWRQFRKSQLALRKSFLRLVEGLEQNHAIHITNNPGGSL